MHLAGRAAAPKRLSANRGQKRDVVYEKVLVDIICGALAPGEVIDELSLVRRYGTGRAGIRDALFRLALEGLVERRPRLGSVVTSPSIIEMQQVFQLRVQLEGQCAKLAACNGTEEELRAIQNALNDAGRAIERSDWRALVCLDREFHRAVATAAHNVWLKNVLETLHNSALRFWHYALPRRPVKALNQEIAYHRKVAVAIQARDAAGAEKAMRAVLGEFPATVQGIFTEEALPRR